MLNPGHAAKIFMAREAVDFRLGFDGLANLCKRVAKRDPYGGGIFLFFNRSMTKAKLIFFDGSGCVLVWKRLEAGKYKFPKVSADGSFATISSTDMTMLLEGVDAAKLSRPRRWNPKKDKP